MMAKFNLPKRPLRPWGMAALMIGLSACSTPTSPIAQAESFTFLPPYLPGWEAYEAIDNDGVALPSGELTPFSLAQSLLTEPETMECFGTAQVRIEALDNGDMAVLSTRVGLCDDSVGAIEQRFDLALTSMGWALNQSGQRFGCRRPEFAWATPGTLCP